MRVALLGSKLSAPVRKNTTGARSPETPLQGWATPASGAIGRGLERLAQARPSAARGIIFGLGFSALIWAAIVGFILAL